MQEYVGVVLHKRSAVIVKKNRRGEITEKATVPTTAVALERLSLMKSPFDLSSRDWVRQFRWSARLQQVAPQR